MFVVFECLGTYVSFWIQLRFDAWERKREKNSHEKERWQRIHKIFVSCIIKLDECICVWIHIKIGQQTFQWISFKIFAGIFLSISLFFASSTTVNSPIWHIPENNSFNGIHWVHYFILLHRFLYRSK